MGLPTSASGWPSLLEKQRSRCQPGGHGDTHRHQIPQSASETSGLTDSDGSCYAGRERWPFRVRLMAVCQRV
jgi:hypothetical protein